MRARSVELESALVREPSVSVSVCGTVRLQFSGTPEEKGSSYVPTRSGLSDRKRAADVSGCEVFDGCRLLGLGALGCLQSIGHRLLQSLLLQPID